MRLFKVIKNVKFKQNSSKIEINSNINIQIFKRSTYN